jgi:hypothetical protein
MEGGVLIEVRGRSSFPPCAFLSFTAPEAV